MSHARETRSKITSDEVLILAPQDVVLDLDVSAGTPPKGDSVAAHVVKPCRGKEDRRVVDFDDTVPQVL
jgi:hypothetical protein